MNKLKDFFNHLSPTQKRNVIIMLVCFCMIILLFLGYTSRSSSGERIEVPKEIKQKSISLTESDEDLALRLSLKEEVDGIQEKNENKIQEQEDKINSLIKKLEELEQQQRQNNTNDNTTSQYGNLQLNGIPESPYYDDETTYIPSNDEEQKKEKLPPIIINGNIGIVTYKPLQDNSTVTNTGKQLINFIPAGSLLKGTLLNGMYAPTMSKGKSKPYPALFRLNDLGFLPNGVRKDLSGCFVLGEAYGELSDSRVHIRLSTLSCISNNQQRVLEKDIKGFVNGDDGKLGIFGEIRANFGKLALHTLLAEFLSAAGEAVSSASETIIQNPIGGITSIKADDVGDMAMGAAGAGLGEAASMLAEFYLDIMKEMSPVIEVSGRRNVEIIIDKGIELLTDDFHWQGVKEDEEDSIKNILNNK